MARKSAVVGNRTYAIEKWVAANLKNQPLQLKIPQKQH